MTENEISKIVVDLGLKVYKKLGIGLLESVYETCLAYELEKIGLRIERQKSLPILYEEIRIENAFRVDILVENKVVLEIKSVENLANIHFVQLNNYLRLGNYKLGLLLNFNTQLFKNGIKRIANGLDYI